MLPKKKFLSFTKHLKIVNSVALASCREYITYKYNARSKPMEMIKQNQ